MYLALCLTPRKPFILCWTRSLGFTAYTWHLLEGCLPTNTMSTQHQCKTQLLPKHSTHPVQPYLVPPEWMIGLAPVQHLHIYPLAPGVLRMSPRLPPANHRPKDTACLFSPSACATSIFNHLWNKAKKASTCQTFSPKDKKPSLELKKYWGITLYNFLSAEGTLCSSSSPSHWHIHCTGSGNKNICWVPVQGYFKRLVENKRQVYFIAKMFGIWGWHYIILKTRTL